MTLKGDAKRAYQREFLARRRREWIDSQGGCCANCGSTEDLEIDHIDPSTKLCNPSQVWSRCREFREAELAKCQVLCADCHKAKTREEFVSSEHGSRAMYDTHKCRCDVCVQAMRDRFARYKAVPPANPISEEAHV